MIQSIKNKAKRVAETDDDVYDSFPFRLELGYFDQWEKEDSRLHPMKGLTEAVVEMQGRPVATKEGKEKRDTAL